MLFLEKKLSKIKSRSLVTLIYSAVLAVGFFDQTNTVRQTKSFAIVEQFFYGIKEERIEGREQAIFVLPYLEWPDQGNHLYLIGLIEEIGEKWSTPTPEGRDEAKWQKYISGLETSQMLDAIKACGYTGVYMDTEACRQEYGSDVADRDLNNLVMVLGEPDVSDQVNGLYYWNLE